ncbi:MAG: YqgE/AlgH family protein [Pseudomonadales bacterium]
MAAEDSLRGQFLLAMPGLTGGYFGNSLIYLCEHNPDGAMGLVVNRPGDLTLGNLFAQLNITTDAPARREPVLEGGPVASERGFILHGDDHTLAASLPVGDGLMLTAALEMLEAIAAGTGPAQFLIALGYAGWGAGQLEQELKDNAWLNCRVEPVVCRSILFDTPFETRIHRAAEALGIDFRLMTGQIGHA